MKMSFALMGLLLAGVATSAVAQDQPGFPYYASVKRGEVNVRSGPGNQYPILWIYQRAGYPVQVLAKYDNYYKIRDAEDEEGWVFVGMISAKKTGLVGGRNPAPLYRKDTNTSEIVAKLAPNVVVELNECSTTLCKVEVDDFKGWIEKSRLLMIE